MVMMIWYWKYMGMSSGGPTVGVRGTEVLRAALPPTPPSPILSARPLSWLEEQEGPQLKRRPAAHAEAAGSRQHPHPPTPHPGPRSKGPAGLGPVCLKAQEGSAGVSGEG